jgi:hypothetical protein
MSMLKELIQEKHSCKKSKSNERGVCPVFREIAHIQVKNCVHLPFHRSQQTLVIGITTAVSCFIFLFSIDYVKRFYISFVMICRN